MLQRRRCVLSPTIALHARYTAVACFLVLVKIWLLLAVRTEPCVRHRGDLVRESCEECGLVQGGKWIGPPVLR